MAKKTDAEKNAAKLAKRNLHLAKMAIKALDKNISYLSEEEAFMRLATEQGIAPKGTSFMGEPEAPVILSANNIHDSVSCEKCGHKFDVYPRHVPNILLVWKSFSNGIAHPLRRLIEKFGLLYSKSGQILSLMGFSEINPEEERPNPPKNVMDFYEALVEKGDVDCALIGTDERCKGRLTNSPRNWNVDHKYFSTTYHTYNTDKAYREDVENYQPLCISCNSRKRELNIKDKGLLALLKQ